MVYFVLFLYFCVSLDHFGFAFSNLVLLGLFFYYLAKRLSGKDVSEMTYFMSSGTYNLTHFSSVSGSGRAIGIWVCLCVWCPNNIF